MDHAQCWETITSDYKLIMFLTTHTLPLVSIDVLTWIIAYIWQLAESVLQTLKQNF